MALHFIVAHLFCVVLLQVFLLPGWFKHHRRKEQKSCAVL